MHSMAPLIFSLSTALWTTTLPRSIIYTLYAILHTAADVWIAREVDIWNEIMSNKNLYIFYTYVSRIGMRESQIYSQSHVISPHSFLEFFSNLFSGNY